MSDSTSLRVVLGLMVVGPAGVPGARLTGLDKLNAALDIFQGRGHNEIDTARLYLGGKQEAFTREAGWKEKGLAVATKAWPTSPGLHAPEALAATLETSLVELGTDCVDIFYLHAPDRSVPFSVTLEAVDKLYKAGKFKRLGLSNYTAFEVAEIVTMCAHRGFVRPTIYQALYNCLFRNIEDELVPACRRYGIAIDAYSPTGGGFLAGAITSVDADPAEGRYAKGPMQHLTRGRYFRDGIIEGARIIRQAAEETGIPPLEVAMRWLVHHSALRGGNGGGQEGRDGVVIGFSSLEQLRQNLDSLDKGPLGPELLDALERAWRVARPDAGAYWLTPMVYTYDTQEALFGKAA
ncbi:NADP-dependent oxidoreductase domain-containing protein [Xylaria sp. FL0064]|nr:NADP-dependent oxidoreductase domain-containing protein [Xylaria sp. FL0064]